jgi:hypothetical protein
MASKRFARDDRLVLALHGACKPRTSSCVARFEIDLEDAVHDLAAEYELLDVNEGFVLDGVKERKTAPGFGFRSLSVATDNAEIFGELSGLLLPDGEETRLDESIAVPEDYGKVEGHTLPVIASEQVIEAEVPEASGQWGDVECEVDGLIMDEIAEERPHEEVYLDGDTRSVEDREESGDAVEEQRRETTDGNKLFKKLMETRKQRKAAAKTKRNSEKVEEANAEDEPNEMADTAAHSMQGEQAEEVTLVAAQCVQDEEAVKLLEMANTAAQHIQEETERANEIEREFVKLWSGRIEKHGRANVDKHFYFRGLLQKRYNCKLKMRKIDGFNSDNGIEGYDERTFKWAIRTLG